MKPSLSLQQHVLNSLAQCIKRSLVAALLLFCAVATGKMYAQEVPVDTWYCGIKLTIPGTYNMTDDITCPAGAVGIVVAAPRVTLYLQGHWITGAYSSKDDGSWGLVVGQPYVSIKGPGLIQGFARGIKLTTSNDVSHVQIERCIFQGISAGYSNKITYNTLRQAGTAISANSMNTVIQGNTVTGSSLALQLAAGSADLVAGNVFVANNSGMTSVMSPGISKITVTGNDISSNKYGTSLGGPGTITGNHFNANQGAGLYVLNGTFDIENNTADGNGQYGFSLAGSNNIIKSNTALGNGVLDLNWDGNGKGNTWANNNCDTWSLNMGATPCQAP